MLGTAAVVLPLRQPWLTLKAANSVDELSDGRLLLGVASGDRPMEYPLFGVDYDQRGEIFRDTVELLRSQGEGRLPEGARLLPERDQPVPLLVAGLGQQSPAWIGQHMDGWLAYPGTPDEHRRRVGLWREVGGDKPYISFVHLDLAANPHAPMRRVRFGGSCGRLALIDELQALREAVCSTLACICVVASDRLPRLLKRSLNTFCRSFTNDAGTWDSRCYPFFATPLSCGQNKTPTCIRR